MAHPDHLIIWELHQMVSGYSGASPLWFALIRDVTVNLIFAILTLLFFNARFAYFTFFETVAHELSCFQCMFVTV